MTVTFNSPGQHITFNDPRYSFNGYAPRTYPSRAGESRGESAARWATWWEHHQSICRNPLHGHSRGTPPPMPDSWQ